MWTLRVFALAAIAVAAGPARVRARPPHVTTHDFTTVQLRRGLVTGDVRQGVGGGDLEAEIQSYYTGSGFPKAGRTFQQKINEADAFLAKNLPTIGAVGVGTAIVYKDQVVYAKGHGLRRYNDPASTATKDDIFQIGSVTKTFIALGVGLLVEDGKLQWNDPVKTHLPWFKLFDKYAEEHVRVGDLLSMNSGLGAQPDLAMFTGAYDSARKLVEALEFSEPEYSLRETPAYANINFVILGQLIEEVSGTPWHTFLKERIWTPLGMNRTFAHVTDVPSNLQASALNDGHFQCEKNVRGPLSFVNDSSLELSPTFKYDAAGSIVSSPSDMTKLLRLVLNKGTVDGVKLFQSPSTISDMITGKNMATFVGNISIQGTEFYPDGNSLSAGYGFDLIGNVMWGHALAYKNGGTYVHITSSSYAPNDGLGVVMIVNSYGPVANYVDQVRSYVMGIFLDVPKPILDLQYPKWRSLVRSPSAPIPGAPACGFSFWENPPHLNVSRRDGDALVGEYLTTISPKFSPPASVARGASDNEFVLRVGAITATIFYVGDVSGMKVFMAERGANLIVEVVPVTPDTEHEGSFLLNIEGMDYRKQYEHWHRSYGRTV